MTNCAGRASRAAHIVNEHQRDMLAILVATSIPAALTPGANPFFAVVQSSVGNAARTASDAVRNSPAVATGLFATASKAVQQSPAVAVGSFAAGVAAGCAGSTFQRCLDLYLTADDMPGSHLRQHRSIAAKVVAVSDGDTLRVRHTPTLLSSGKFKGKLSENTISVRIAAVDTPETAKFGQPGQPLGADAKAFTKRLLNRRVRVRCYARDQYGRIVGTVQYGIRRRDLSTELLRKGLASVYRSAGAVYAQRPLGGWDAIEARAQRNRLGMWQRGVSAAMLPGEFKARQRKRKAKS